MLSNLYDFDPRKDAYAFTEKDAASIDAWALGELNRVIAAVRGGFENYDFATVRETIFSFCNEALSSVYMAATKDRLYCDKADSPRRRRTQTAMHRIADGLIRLIAPVMVHTADEAWLALHGKTMEDEAMCIHTEPLPEPKVVPVDADWVKVMGLRSDALRVIETSRQSAGVENPMDLWLKCISIHDNGKYFEKFKNEFGDLCNVSDIESLEIHQDGSGVWPISFEAVNKSSLPQCERSRKRDRTVKLRSDGSMLSDRDADALGLA